MTRDIFRALPADVHIQQKKARRSKKNELYFCAVYYIRSHKLNRLYLEENYFLFLLIPISRLFRIASTVHRRCHFFTRHRVKYLTAQ